jgi:hypothetical protein
MKNKVEGRTGSNEEWKEEQGGMRNVMELETMWKINKMD